MLEIDKISAGWIEGSISDGEQEVVFDYSYLENFLNDLMETLLCVHGDWKSFGYRESFRAELEPAVEDWILSKTNDQLIINIKSYKDDCSKIMMKEVTLEFIFTDFLNEFVKAMDRVLKHYGFVGYRENWGFDFPIGLYLRIKNMCNEQKRLHVQELWDEDYFEETDMSADIISDLNKELELLRA